MLDMLKKAANASAVAAYLILIVVPLWLALDRLIWVSGFDVGNWFNSLDENYVSQDVVAFTVKQAILSTITTLAIGIPIAWQLGRYKWPLQSLIKSILTMPFVMPSWFVAMHFCCCR